MDATGAGEGETWAGEGEAATLALLAAARFAGFAEAVAASAETVAARLAG